MFKAPVSTIYPSCNTKFVVWVPNFAGFLSNLYQTLFLECALIRTLASWATKGYLFEKKSYKGLGSFMTYLTPVFLLLLTRTCWLLWGTSSIWFSPRWADACSFFKASYSVSLAFFSPFLLSPLHTDVTTKYSDIFLASILENALLLFLHGLLIVRRMIVELAETVASTPAPSAFSLPGCSHWNFEHNF